MKVYQHTSFRGALAAGLVIAGVTFGSSQNLKVQNFAPDDPVVIKTDVVSLNVSVTDSYGRAVPGLDKSAFSIFDDKVQQTITFFSDEDEPASIAIVFDTSGSMSGDKIARAKETLAHFMQTGHPRDEYFLVDFGSQARLLLDRTRDGDAVFRKFTFVQPHGNTALYDAVYLGIEKVMRSDYQKRAILLISDGEDNASRHSLDELRRQLRESDATIYAIGIVQNSLPRKGQVNGKETLEELASVTGGKAFFPGSPAEMTEAFERIGLELRHMYSIGYRPSNFALNRDWHRLKVKVDPRAGFPRLFVRSRAGYYSIADN